MFYEFKVGEKTYNLRLTTRATVALEKKIGCNPLSIFGDGDRIPKVTEMLAILASSLTELNHGITENDAAEIFDAWLEEGHSVTDFIPIIVDIYRASGLIRDKKGKNA